MVCVHAHTHPTTHSLTNTVLRRLQRSPPGGEQEEEEEEQEEEQEEEGQAEGGEEETQRPALLVLLPGWRERRKERKTPAPRVLPPRLRARPRQDQGL